MPKFLGHDGLRGRGNVATRLLGRPEDGRWPVSGRGSLSAGVCSAAWPTSPRSWPPSSRATRTAAAELLPLVYDELRRLAAARMAEEKPGQTLQATALVHEAYVRLVGGDEARQWAGRGHFFAAAAEAMRRILVESARRKGSLKRGGGRARAELRDADLAADEAPDEVLAVDEALAGLAAADPQAAELVKLRYFAGLSVPEAADGAGPDDPHRRAAVGVRPGLAPPGPGRAGTPCRGRFPRQSEKMAGFRPRFAPSLVAGATCRPVERDSHDRTVRLPGRAGVRRPGRAVGVPGPRLRRRPGPAGRRSSSS